MNNTKSIQMPDGYDSGRMFERWRRLRKKPHDPMFDDFKSFCDWSMRNGYTSVASLLKIDKSQPFTPENCIWREPDVDCAIRGEEAKERCRKRNETVNRIRIAFGMEPFELEDEII